MPRDIDIFRQTGLGKKIAALDNKHMQFDNYDGLISELISEEKCLHEKYSKELKLQKLKYQNMLLLQELEETKLQTKLNKLQFEYDKLEKEYYLNRNVEEESDIELKRSHAITFLYNINTIDIDETDYLDKLISDTNNIYLLNIINKLLIKSYCTNVVINIDLIRNELRKDDKINRFVFGKG